MQNDLKRNGSGYGDDYYFDDDGELVCRCPECPNNREDEEDIWMT